MNEEREDNEEEREENEEEREDEDDILYKIYNFVKGAANRLINKGIDVISDTLDIDVENASTEEIQESAEKFATIMETVTPIVSPIVKKTANQIAVEVGRLGAKSAEAAVKEARNVVSVIPGVPILLAVSDAGKFADDVIKTATKVTNEVSTSATDIQDAVNAKFQNELNGLPGIPRTRKQRGGESSRRKSRKQSAMEVHNRIQQISDQFNPTKKTTRKKRIKNVSV